MPDSILRAVSDVQRQGIQGIGVYGTDGRDVEDGPGGVLNGQNKKRQIMTARWTSRFLEGGV